MPPAAACLDQYCISRAGGSFFMVGGRLSENVGSHHCLPRSKNFKKNWLKHPKITHFGHSHKKRKVINNLRLLCYFEKGWCAELLRPPGLLTSPSYDYLLQYSFAWKTSLILWTSTHLTLKIRCSCSTFKNLSDFTNFPANMFQFAARKNISTALFLDIPELYSWSTLKGNVCILLYISIKKIVPGT